MKIFVLGVTGYIGGSVAASLQASGHEVFGTARKPEDIAKLEARGIQATRATLDDIAQIEALAKRADAVINAADADHRPSVEVILRALEGTGRRYIHTSGSSIVSTDAEGRFLPAVYDEATLPTPVAEKRARVAIDQLVREASSRKVHSAVICPTLIYGMGRGLHTESIQVPMLAKLARESKHARYIGLGENVWSNVHINDLADLYLLVLEKAEPGAFFFAENGEAAARETVAAIGRRFDVPVGSMSVAEAVGHWGAEGARLGLASNSRVRAKAGRALGWSPRGPSLIESIGLL